MSPGVENSLGEWLIPPMLGMNFIPTGPRMRWNMGCTLAASRSLQFVTDSRSSGLDGERGRNRTFNLLIKSTWPTWNQQLSPMCKNCGKLASVAARRICFHFANKPVQSAIGHKIRHIAERYSYVPERDPILRSIGGVRN
jgi:hypothetical protein